jgi:hypothetical protein
MAVNVKTKANQKGFLSLQNWQTKSENSRSQIA